MDSNKCITNFNHFQFPANGELFAVKPDVIWNTKNEGNNILVKR